VGRAVERHHYLLNVKSTHADRAAQYCRDVIAGTIPACKWVRLACERQVADLQREDWVFSYDVAKANKVCDFIELLPHIKGKWENPTIKLEPWQCFILCTVFGWVHKKTKLRRFRTAYIEVPRKNAKSTLSSGVGLYMLTEDGEEGAEVYSAATTREQAKVVFGVAQGMARKTGDLRAHYGLEVGAHNINVLRTSSKFEALSAEGETLDGLNIHCALIDELHAHKTRDVWDVLETGTGSRDQSLIWTITTAGSNKTGICYEQRDYVTKILERTIQDETYFGLIYTLDLAYTDVAGVVHPGDDWNCEASWRKCNPNYGVSVKPEDIARLAHKAAQTPAAVNNFLTKRANVWVQSDVGLFDMAAWQKCGDLKLKPEDFAGCPCYLGVDLGFVDDIAAVVKVFMRDGIPHVFGRYYLPEETIAESRNSQYSGWHRMGKIVGTDGNVTDEERIIDDLADDLTKYDVKEFAFDPYNALKITNPLLKRGVSESRLLGFPQTVAMMSPATEGLMKRVRAGEIRHDGCPVLTWAMSNVVGHYDSKDNVYPKKERPENKIDPAIALIMASARATIGAGNSVYESRGMLVLG
jgi:phage terminase large subunit-like protein